MENQKEVQNILMALARVLVALGIIGTVIYFTPILDTLVYFAYAFVIPVMFLVSIGALSKDALLIFSLSAKQIRERVAHHRETLNAAT
jgi:hypothetical protein